MRPLQAKLQHFYLFDPCRAKLLTSDFFFNNYKTVRRRLVKLYFFWIVIIRGICWYGFWQHWSNFLIWPLYKLSCYLQAFFTGCDPVAIWNGDPWTPTNIMIFFCFVFVFLFLFLFSRVNFASVRPNITHFTVERSQTTFFRKSTFLISKRRYQKHYYGMTYPSLEHVCTKIHSSLPSKSIYFAYLCSLNCAVEEESHTINRSLVSMRPLNMHRKHNDMLSFESQRYCAFLIKSQFLG